MLVDPWEIQSNGRKEEVDLIEIEGAKRSSVGKDESCIVFDGERLQA
jgi:hypothetical protein